MVYMYLFNRKIFIPFIRLSNNMRKSLAAVQINYNRKLL